MTSRRRRRMRVADGASARPSGDRVSAVPFREIRSGVFPLGFPDRCDETILEAFGNAWLLLIHAGSGPELVGMAADYESA